MRYQWIIVLAILFFSSQVMGEEKGAPKTQKDKVSYVIGMDIGTNLKKQSIEVNPDLLFKGIKDGLSGNKPMMSDQEIKETIATFQKEIQAKREEMAKKIGEKNRKGGRGLSCRKPEEGWSGYAGQWTSI